MDRFQVGTTTTTTFSGLGFTSQAWMLEYALWVTHMHLLEHCQEDTLTHISWNIAKRILLCRAHSIVMCNNNYAPGWHITLSVPQQLNRTTMDWLLKACNVICEGDTVWIDGAWGWGWVTIVFAWSMTLIWLEYVGTLGGDTQSCQTMSIALSEYSGEHRAQELTICECSKEIKTGCAIKG